MKVLDKLPQNPNNYKLAWLLRHAEREQNQDKLTENGRKQAYRFGLELQPYKVNAIYSSPSDRCVETAKLIAEAYGKDIPIILDNTIAEVGVYVTDMDLALETYHKLGKELFFKKLLTDQPLPGYNLYSKAAKIISNFIKQNTIENGLTLFITHNFIIRMLNHWLRNLSYKDKLMKVNYLDGIIINVEN